jgi:uncharacterized membrane protein YjdF
LAFLLYTFLLKATGFCTFSSLVTHIFWATMPIEPYSRFDWLLENLPFHAYAGAHYSYGGTPLDAWLHRLFHTERNSYDRVVHFSYGLLLAYPIKKLIVIPNYYRL